MCQMPGRHRSGDKSYRVAKQKENMLGGGCQVRVSRIWGWWTTNFAATSFTASWGVGQARSSALIPYAQNHQKETQPRTMASWIRLPRRAQQQPSAPLTLQASSCMMFCMWCRMQRGDASMPPTAARRHQIQVECSLRPAIRACSLYHTISSRPSSR